ncbi:hypothetical protein [Candidatus Electronema sp. PJ]|uniref:hypothetical protein n=1 Tax=Candidatus Electronema sp. PJ TaxID=3401572 RepID=UPI003AA90381
MNKLMAVLLSGCILLFLTACPNSGPKQESPPGKPCGSRGMTSCPADQYCKFEIDAKCGITDSPGICTPIPKLCLEDVYNPICGCDGKNYNNACKAASEGVSVKNRGACEQMCGGIAGISCPDGQECIDDPTDNCNPAQGGADCPGICELQ